MEFGLSVILAGALSLITVVRLYKPHAVVSRKYYSRSAFMCVVAMFIYGAGYLIMAFAPQAVDAMWFGVLLYGIALLCCTLSIWSLFLSIGMTLAWNSEQVTTGSGPDADADSMNPSGALPSDG